MAAPKTALSMWSQYAAARLADSLIKICPVQANLQMAHGIGTLAYHLSRRHRHRIQHNLNIAFPLMPENEKNAIAKASMQHLIQLVVDVLYSPRLLNSGSWSQRSQVDFPELSDAVPLLNSKRPVMMITGHIGNWEIMGLTLSLLGLPIHALARPLDNPAINTWIKSLREKRGMTIIDKWDAVDQMLEVIQTGGALGFIADQNAGDRGLFVPFFGKLASCYKSIGLMAVKENVPLICGYAKRASTRDLHYSLHVVDTIYPADWQDQPDPIYYVSARYIRAIETMVRQTPHQYLWAHRRWKSRPRFERESKPMSKSLEKRLVALPWMTDTLMQSLREPFPAYP